ncbi:membrane-bound lytic murein transglycosylase D [Vogesella indigofera]|uniref:Membrane-bound lytic murein transglycosylase D n=1 Tax=Vogesella indigofera TaxID=45465 RepID=A0A495B3U1_VOGIN|nr:LysM peptidoglycan-binding domain-containing protein [Vogesella indigofera]RKQ55340.1 membrane-bound lytic murein transglycosylase D [Vogesella indigofera]
MKKFTPLALAVLLALPAAHATTSVTIPGWSTPGVDDGLAAGLDMMLINTSLLRNGDNVWQRAREGFQLPEVNPELVRRHEKYYTARPEYLRRTLDRSRKYLFHIMNEVEKRGMPTELAFLPVVESSFVPSASSPVGAAGLWQFMPATGREYELEQTWWYDGRRDVVESTRAALDYLQVLYNRFGDWNLALAAYNWGQGNLSKAISRVRAKGETETYENIVMPAETRNYAPKLLAIRNIMAQPENFGLRIDVLPNKPAFVAVSTGKHMNIDIAAKLAEMPVSEFKELNPAFNLPVYAHKSGRQMLLPATKLHRFETNLAKWDKPLLTWQVHVPESDLSVTELAQQFDMNPNELLVANSLQGNRTVNAGRPVLVAARNQDTPATLEASDIAPASAPVLLASNPVSSSEQPVVRVASLSVAATTQTTVTPAIAPAVASVVSSPAASTPANSPMTPVAVPVAAPVVALAANSPAASVTPVAVVASSVVAPAATSGNSTTVALSQPVSKPQAAPTPRAKPAPTVVASASDAPELPLRPATRVENHVVANGDTLYNISRRYNMSVAELKSLNTLNSDAVKLGQNLRVLGAPLGNVTASVTSPLRTVAYQQPARKSTEYVVQAGDTVFSIARKFGIHHSDIQRWNTQLVANQIQPGQVLRVEDGGL